MAGGTWDVTSLPVRPGLYLNFKEAAAAQIVGGARGIVAIPLTSFAEGTAEAKAFYTVGNETEAAKLFGADHIQSIKLALQGGAKEVLVYTLPESAEAADYADMRAAFDTRPFNVFAYDGEFSEIEQTALKAWIAANREEGKHFMAVIGGTSAADTDPAQGNARSIAHNDMYIVNLISGVSIQGTAYSSAQFAPYVAGMIAGTAINRSITYAPIAADDVTKRLTSSQVKDALLAGSLVLVHDGEKVKVEQGLTSSKHKIRGIRTRQAVSTDIARTANDTYIGKIDNSKDGQAALISAVKAYLESLEAYNTLSDVSVILDPQHPSTGDSVYLQISYREIDSMERIFLTVTL